MCNNPNDDVNKNLSYIAGQDFNVTDESDCRDYNKNS